MITNRTELDQALKTLSIGSRENISALFVEQDLSEAEQRILVDIGCLGYDTNNWMYYIEGNAYTSSLCSFSPPEKKKVADTVDVDYLDIVKGLCNL